MEPNHKSFMRVVGREDVIEGHKCMSPPPLSEAILHNPSYKLGNRLFSLGIPAARVLPPFPGKLKTENDKQKSICQLGLNEQGYMLSKVILKLKQLMCVLHCLEGLT